VWSSSTRLLGNEDDRKKDNEKIDFGFQSIEKEEKQNLVRQVFSSVAPSYDIMNDLMSGGLHRLWKDRFVEMLSPFPGMRHIDVAGGTGDVAFRVLKAIEGAESLPNDQTSSSRGHVTIFDINPAMLEQGIKKAERSGLDESRLEWVEGSAEELPFEENSFDSYTIAFGIRNVTNRDAALTEAFRVLKPGGRFLCLEFSKLVVPGLQHLYDEYSFRVIPELGRFVAGDSDSYKYLIESIRMFPDQEKFSKMIRDAGFSMVSYENLTAGVTAIHSGIKL
jgi:2-methoxy-6-polyprenyl-1,4-benzoquinol methylase